VGKELDQPIRVGARNGGVFDERDPLKRQKAKHKVPGVSLDWPFPRAHETPAWETDWCHPGVTGGNLAWGQ